MPASLHRTTCSICRQHFLAWHSDEEVIAAAVAERGAHAYPEGAVIVCEGCHTSYAHLGGAQDAFTLPTSWGSRR